MINKFALLGFVGLLSLQAQGWETEPTHFTPPTRHFRLGPGTYDKRVEIEQSGPYRAIGILQEAIGLFGTAFLVSECHILTNFHVAFTLHGRPLNPSHDVVQEFWFGDQINPQRFKTAARPLVWGDLDRSTEDSMRATQFEDWALLRLSECVGARQGYLALNPLKSHQLIDREHLSVGFSADKFEQGQVRLWGQPGCQFSPVYPPGRLLHDCVSYPGNSGAPVIYENRWRRRLEVVALTRSVVVESDLHFQGPTGTLSLRWYSSAVPVYHFYERVMRAMKMDLANHPPPSKISLRR